MTARRYQLNLIDTPGHVDFHYEVSRSLAACEGALLVVDAAQGVEAQTLANVYVALDNDLEIIPVINKIDLPVARPDEVKQQIEDVDRPRRQRRARWSPPRPGRASTRSSRPSSQRVPPPVGDRAAPLRALIFDSWYDAYRGVVALVRVFDGTIRPGMKLRFMGHRRRPTSARSWRSAGPRWSRSTRSRPARSA